MIEPKKEYVDAMYGAESSKTDMLYWYPLLEKTGLRMPETVLIPLKQTLSSERLCMSTAEWALFLDEIRVRLLKAAEQVGYPLFLRTGQASGKHEWAKSCFVAGPEDLLSHLARVIEFSAMADCMCGGLPVSSIVVRRYVPLESTFKAFLGMPVARERRYFVRDGKVECGHPYWIPEAIQFYCKEDEIIDWKERLAILNYQSKKEISKLTWKAEQAGKVLGGFWSIDFAKAQDGHWYLIDCALGDVSYHVPHEDKL